MLSVLRKHLFTLLLLTTTVGISPLSLSQTIISDSTIGYSTTLSGANDWQVSNDNGAKQSTLCANSPESITPLALICVTTDRRQHPKALTDTHYREQLVKGFIEGVCKPYKCNNAKNLPLVKKTYGKLTGWQLDTELGLADYVNNGLAGTVFFATLTEKGELQLLGLHTTPGKTEQYSTIYQSAITSMTYP